MIYVGFILGFRKANGLVGSTGNPILRVEVLLQEDDKMPELSLSPDYVARLIVKMRGVQGRESLTDPQSGSNAPDDGEIDALQDTPGDLSREEIREEISGLSPGEQAELVALLWTGRGDAEPEDWTATVALAADRHETPTAHYLMSDPLVADFWADGLEKLGVGVPMGNDASL